MDQIRFEQALSQLPLLQYVFLSPGELTFSPRIRHVCQAECPMWGKTWACPPAVGSVEDCKAKCLSYDHALLLTTVTEVQDIANLEETLATRQDHEDVTRQAKDALADCGGQDCFVLSTEACSHCDHCTYPTEPCRHPERMFPCVESHGIVVTDLAQRYEIEFLMGNLVVWFSILFYND